MNCIVVDDEPLARGEMQQLIREVSDLVIIGSFPNARKALTFLQEQPVDLIFLDIEMPGLNGLEFAAGLPQQSLLIFTTAYPQYALKSYELDAIDYLLKPIEKGRLQKAITKAENYNRLLTGNEVKAVVEGHTPDFLLIKSDRRFYKIFSNDILFIEGLKDYVIIHTAKEQKLITVGNLKTIHQKLSPTRFLRVSKSYVVNIDCIDSFDYRNVFLGEMEIPLGEAYRKDFLVAFTGGALGAD